jgi:hypothetical protein
MGRDKVGAKTFYAGMRDSVASSESTVYAEEDEQSIHCQVENEYDSGQENLDVAVGIIQQQTLKDEVIGLGNTFIQDIKDKVQQLDT